MAHKAQGSTQPVTTSVDWNRWNRFLLIGASIHFAIAYLVNTSPFLNLDAFAAGLERAPFQYRALTAWLLLFGQHLLHIPERFALYLPLRLRTPNTFTLLTLVFGSLLLGTYATRKSLEILTGDIHSSRWWALLVIFMSYFHYLLDFGHPCCTPFQLPYDLPSMAFFAVSLWALVAGRTPLFYVSFAVATLNRESSLFLILIFLLYQSVGVRNIRSPGLGRLVGHAFGLVALWLVIFTFLHHLYAPPPMEGPHIGYFGLHIFDNLVYLARPYYWASYLSIFGFTWLFTFSKALQIPHAGIRRALLATPVCVACLYVVGVFSEIRIFGELISLHVIAFALLMQALLHKQRAGTGESPLVPYAERPGL